MARDDDYTEALEELRQRLRQDSNNEKITKGDYNRIFKDDWWPISFLAPYDFDVDIAYAVLFECLKWRTTFGIHRISLLELRPLLEKSAIYIHGKDVEDRSILWIRMNQIKVGERNLDKLLIYWLERHTTERQVAPMTVVFDMAGTGLQNMGLDFIKFLLHSFKYYFPCCLASLLVFENPSVLNASWKLVRSWMDPVVQRCFQHVTRTSITSFISPEYLPTHMGGQDNFTFTMDELARCIPTQSNSEPAAENARPDLDSFATKRNVKFDSEEPTILAAPENAHHRTLSVTKRNSISLPAALQPLANSRKNAPLSESITNKFLTICPKDELTLNVIDGENDPVDLVALKNEGTKDVIYKIKITSPEKFRVRPSTGTVSPGKTEFIRVYLQNEYKHTINREKFLIMAVESGIQDASDFSNLWKAADEASKVEHKLRCRLAREISNPSPSPALRTPIANHSPVTYDTNESLRRQVSEISQQQQRLSIGVIILISLQILSLFCIFMLYSSVKTIQNTPPPQMTPVTVEPYDVDSDL